MRISRKAPLPHRGRGGPSPHGSAQRAARGQAPGLVGEGSTAFPSSRLPPAITDQSIRRGRSFELALVP
jgi:hypothetical protein